MQTLRCLPYEVMPVAIVIAKALQRMRGGAQSQLMLGEDGHMWVVKFLNNPQHVRVLTNEWIVSCLARHLGLSVPEPAVVAVSPEFVKDNPELRFISCGNGQACCSGLHFGSKFVGVAKNELQDYIPEEQLCKVKNAREFLGMLCVDKWVDNCDCRQAVFVRKRPRAKFHAFFIDQGSCFNCGEWNFLDLPLRGRYHRTVVYECVTRWSSFEPWLSRVETFSPETLWQIVKSVPSDWYIEDSNAVDNLVEQLLLRRSKVRGLILAFKNSALSPFPNWAGRSSVTMPRQSYPEL